MSANSVDRQPIPATSPTFATAAAQQTPAPTATVTPPAGAAAPATLPSSGNDVTTLVANGETPQAPNQLTFQSKATRPAKAETPPDPSLQTEQAEARMIADIRVGNDPDLAEGQLLVLKDKLQANHGGHVPGWAPIGPAIDKLQGQIHHMRQVQAGVTPKVQEALNAIRKDLADPHTGQDRIVNALTARGVWGLDLESGQRVALYNELAKDPVAWTGVVDRLTFSHFTDWMQALTSEPGASDQTVMRTAVAIQKHRNGEPFQAESDKQLAAVLAKPDTDVPALLQTMRESLDRPSSGKEATEGAIARQMDRSDVPQAIKGKLALAYARKAEEGMLSATDRYLVATPLAELRQTFGTKTTMPEQLDSWISRESRMSLISKYATCVGDAHAPKDLKAWARKQLDAVWEPWVHIRLNADQLQTLSAEVTNIRQHARDGAATLDRLIQHLQREKKTPRPD